MGVTRPKDARVAIRANPGDLVKMAILPSTHTHKPNARTLARRCAHALITR